MLPLIDVVFLNLAFTLAIVGFLINVFEDRLPVFISKNFRYGKFAYVGEATDSFTVVQLPKSYFKHFYASATVLLVTTFIYVFNVYYNGYGVPTWLIAFLDFWCGNDRVAKTTYTSTALVLFLLMVQSIRRCYETFFIQVFADNSKINLLHYIVGHFHYFGCVIAILGQAPEFSKPSDSTTSKYSIDTSIITGVMIVPAILLFSFAWLNQFRSNKILANLRKDSNKKTISQKHFLPRGGWFEFVSSPYILFEILIYVSLTLLIIQNTMWLCVLAWVVSNQVETALLSHQWYKKTFPKLPKQRKALIPYVL